MKLTIIGTGYVGLVTGACFAEVGHHVVCVDNDDAKVKVLQSGGIPIMSPAWTGLSKRTPQRGVSWIPTARRKGSKNRT